MSSYVVRAFLAIILASLAGALAGTAPFFFLAPFIWLFGLLISLPATMVVGSIAHLALQQFGRVRRLDYAVAGVVCGTATMAFCAVALGLGLLSIACGALGGAAAGMTFHAVLGIGKVPVAS